MLSFNFVQVSIVKTNRTMKIQQIRNDTILIAYTGKKILVDPMLSGKGTLPALFHQKRGALNEIP